MSAQPLAPAVRARSTIRRWTRLSTGFTSGFGLLMVALIFVPVALGANSVQDITTLLTYVLMAVMWNALAGYGGLVSIGQQAYIGLGAYATVWLALKGVNPYLGMLLATVFCAAVAVPLSFIMLRFRGAQFAIGTWVVAEALAIWVSLDNALGAGTGTSLDQLDSYSPSSREHYTYWITLGFTAFFIVALFVLLRSRLGSSLQAIRDDEDAAASVGVRVVAGKRILFLLAAAGAGAAGAMTLANTLFIEPTSIFSVNYTAFMIFMVLVGGLGTFEGPDHRRDRLLLPAEQARQRWRLVSRRARRRRDGVRPVPAPRDLGHPRGAHRAAVHATRLSRRASLGRPGRA